MAPPSRADLRRQLDELKSLLRKAQTEGDVALVEQLVDELDATTEEIQIQDARADPNAFIEYCFSDKKGKPLKQGALHRRWQSCIKHPTWNPGGSPRALIVAPRDHGKTTQIPVGRALWELGNDPNLRIKIACQSDSKAMERLFEITDHMERNERVKKVFPHLRPAQRGDWTKHKVVVERQVFSKDASIEALGILSTATGGRCDLLIADDIVDRRNAIQFPQIRETIKHAWKSDWTNLLEPDGRVVYICTLWHTADNSHELMDNKAYTVLSHSVTSDYRKLEAYERPRGGGNRKEWSEPLWEHWDEEALKERREEIGSIEFDRAFRNIALSGDVIVVQEQDINYFQVDKVPEHVSAFQGFDLAISKKQHADFFAGCTVSADPDTGMIYVMDAWHAKLSFMQQAKAVIDDFMAHDPEEQHIETVAYQDSLPQYLDAVAGKPLEDVCLEPGQRRSRNLRVVEEGQTTLEVEPQVVRVPTLPIVRNKPRIDKMSRLKRVTPLLERGKILFHPKLNPQSIGFVRERGDLVTELLQFPLAAHDDLVDAFVLAVLAAIRALLSTQESDEDDDGQALECTVRVLGAM